MTTKHYEPCELCQKIGNSGFSCFFLHASEEERKALITDVVKEANQDQQYLTDVVTFLTESNLIENEVSHEAFVDAMTAWKFAETIETMTTENVLEIHRLLMARLRPDIAGFWRRCNVMIGGKIKKFYTVDLIQTQVQATLDAMNNPSFVTEKDCENAHVVFEDIHPFEDGNGRVGRILWNWHRLKRGFPLKIVHEGKEQMEYYKLFR